MSHYFSPADDTPSDPRTLDVVLRGRSVRVTSDRGVFSTDRLDAGTAVLLAEAPDPPATGTMLDLGCGWGPIALSLALTSPGARVLAVDVNPRALRLTATNARALGATGVETHDPGALLLAEPDLRLDALWSNPPIRVGKPALHAMLRSWLPRLAPDGVGHLVVGKNLGADSLQRWIETELQLSTTRVATARGFRVLAVSQA